MGNWGQRDLSGELVRGGGRWSGGGNGTGGRPGFPRCCGVGRRRWPAGTRCIGRPALGLNYYSLKRWTAAAGSPGQAAAGFVEILPDGLGVAAQDTIEHRGR